MSKTKDTTALEGDEYRTSMTDAESAVRCRTFWMTYNDTNFLGVFYGPVLAKLNSASPKHSREVGLFEYAIFAS